MSKVYIVNQPRGNLRTGIGPTYDVSPAAEWGEIRFIFGKDDFPSPSADLELSINHAWKVLSDFNVEEDYIVWAGGDPISMLIVAPILFDMVDKGIRYLKFERGRNPGGGKPVEGFYTPVEVNLFDEDK